MCLVLCWDHLQAQGQLHRVYWSHQHTASNGSLAESQALSQASGNSNLKVSYIRGSDSVWRRDRLSWFITARAFSTFKRWSSWVASSRKQGRLKWETSEQELPESRDLIRAWIMWKAHSFSWKSISKDPRICENELHFQPLMCNLGLMGLLLLVF